MKNESIATGLTIEACVEERAERRERLTCAHIICAWLTGLALGFLTLALASLVSGCIYKGAKITEGVDLAVGLTVPATDGAVSLDVLNYLSGFRLGVAENARLTVDYKTAETNSYLGCVTTRSVKRVVATVEPCEVNDPDGGGNGDAEKDESNQVAE